MTTMATPTRTAAQLLHIEECDAWFEYLGDTRNQPPDRYREVEPWAWTKLSNKLRTIETRRQANRPPSLMCSRGCTADHCTNASGECGYNG